MNDPTEYVQQPCTLDDTTLTPTFEIVPEKDDLHPDWVKNAAGEIVGYCRLVEMEISPAPESSR